MSKTAFITGVLAFLLLLLVSPSTAEIKTITITSDTRPMILFEKFGFTNQGRVAIAASSVSVVAPSEPNLSRLGFFLISEQSVPQVIIEIQQSPSFCVLDSLYIFRLFTFLDISPPPATSFNCSYPVTISNEYSLLFANCVPDSSVSITLHTEFFNYNADGSRNYLSIGLTPIPSLFSLAFTYFSFLAFWLYLCHVSKRSLHRIHLLIASLLLSKTLNLLCAAADKQYVKLTGTSHGWDVLFFIFNLITVVLLFTVIASVGTRWTFLHPLVRERGKKVLFIVIPLQLLAYVAYVVIHKTGPYIKDWVTWNQLFLLLDFFSSFAFVLLIVWSIRSFRKPKDAMNLDRFRLIRRFYTVLIGYFLLIHFVVFALKTLLVYEYLWVGNLIEDTATLVLCVVIIYVFRLLEKDEYSVIGEEDEDVAKIAVKE